MWKKWLIVTASALFLLVGCNKKETVNQDAKRRCDCRRGDKSSGASGITLITIR